MGNRRTLIAAAAIVLAAVSGIGVYLYVSSADKRARDQVETVQAFVAAADIPKGMTGDAAMSAGLIEAADVLRGSVPPSAVTNSADLEGKIASAKIQAGQYITSATFVSPSEGGGGSLAATIGASTRVAITISVDPAHGVAHAISPGDRVDIYDVQEVPSTLLLADVKVLAVGLTTAANTDVSANPDGQTAPPENAGLVTFEVTREQAQLIADHASHGTLYLALRALASVSGDRSVPASSSR